MTKETRLHNVGKTVSLTNGAGKTGQPHVKKMKLDHSLTLCTKLRSKWIKDLNTRSNTIKLLDENIGSTLSDINSNNVFFNPFPRIMEIKTKISTWDLLKLKSFYTEKETINKTQRQPTYWVKIFANDAMDKELVFKIYRHLITLKSIKTNNPISKWVKDLNKHFSKEYVDE